MRGKEFRRVALSGTPRGGVLAQASVLCVTSNPTRTSPVKRGKWILENILGEPPPNPPPNVPALREDEEAVLSGSVRRRLEQHRADRNCAVCHAKMDSLGFAMENFDPVGAWRTRDGTFAIDASGMLPEGKSFDGPAEFRAILRTDGKEKFLRCLTAKMLTYALGRGLEPYDQRTMDKIAKTVSQRQYKFSALVVEIIKSDPFQKRRSPRENTMKRGFPISRRSLLRGLGAAIALPWLEAMSPRSLLGAGNAAGARLPVRMAFLYVPNGMHMPDWKPGYEGPLAGLPPIMTPLERHRSNLLVLSELALNGAAAVERRAWRSCPGGGRVPYRSPPVQDPRQGHPQRDLGRSNRSREDQQRHPSAVARTRL